jgi:hypothetical protein
MGLRFRKSIRIGKNLRINLSKSGIGASIGVPGYRVGIGPRGKRTTVSLPGTGLSYTTQTGTTQTGTTQSGTTQENKKTNQLQPAQFSASPDINPANKKTCGIVALIGIAFIVLMVVISLIFGFISSVANWIKTEPETMDLDQAVAQLQTTLTMQAALDQVMAEITISATPSLPTPTRAPVMRTFFCQECVNDDGSILPITLWQTPDEIGPQAGKVIHGDRCEVIDTAVSSEGIPKTLVDCPGGRGWTRTESLIP